MDRVLRYEIVRRGRRAALPNKALAVTDMEIKRINTYTDSRFSQAALNQHGCFLVDGIPYEIEIISGFEAVVRGEEGRVFEALINEFRYYAPHITKYYSGQQVAIKEYAPVQIMSIELDEIQPSQFFIDEDKLSAISNFIQKETDIIIQIVPYQGRYVSVDGHTRLYYASMKGWHMIRAVVSESEDWVHRFVEEAGRRGIHKPDDLVLLKHEEYEEKWNQFCEELLKEKKG